MTTVKNVTTVIGLEVHVQLRTETKLFCGCPTTFGSPPNTQVCPTCLGLPGALPVLNRAALDLSIRAGLALGCSIPEVTKWDRKQYFYPDLPKGYQISQFDLPVCVDGFLDVAVDEESASRRIGIVRAHLEEDAGKSSHDEAAGTDDSRIDLNRCGTPLLEIVSAPDLRTAEEARAYLDELKLRMTHLDVSDCEMQEGSLRVDANVNLHLETDDGIVATPIVEVKNMNSFRAVERAIKHEAVRQLEDWEDTGRTIKDVGKTTRGWNDDAGETFLQREKEESADYRYFPDPDLLPIRVPREHVDSIRTSIGELPGETITRLVGQYDIKRYDADVMVHQGPAVVAYFEDVANASGDGKRAAAWMGQDVLRTLKERDVEIEAFPIAAETLGDLVGRIGRGDLDNSRGRDVFAYLLDHPVGVDEAVSALGITAVDAGELDALCRDLLAANPAVADDYRGGKKQAVGQLIGQARKRSPNANPQAVRAKLIELIKNG